VSGVILGEVDCLAGAQAKVDAMIAKAKERASKAAMRSKVAENKRVLTLAVHDDQTTVRQSKSERSTTHVVRHWTWKRH
jgi:hypothetical protein